MHDTMCRNLSRMENGNNNKIGKEVWKKMYGQEKPTISMKQKKTIVQSICIHKIMSAEICHLKYKLKQA